MKRLSTFLCVLALLLVGANVNAAEKSIGVKDFSESPSVPWQGTMPDGASISFSGGYLVINNTSSSGNNYDLQMHLIGGLALQAGYSYKVVVNYECIPTASGGSATVSLKDWGGGSDKYGVNLTSGEGFRDLVLNFDNFPADKGDAFVMWQCRSIVGTIRISRVEVIEIEPDVLPTYTDIITNGTMETIENNHFTVTEQGVGGPYMANIKAGIGKEATRGISVQSSDSPAQDWDTQFFISVPKKLATGTKFKITFDYKASQTAKGTTQWHNAPGGYVWWNCIGDINFTTSWQTFEKNITVPQGEANEEKVDIAPYTIAINLAVTKTATTYYFDNIKLEVLDDDLAGLADAPALTNSAYPSVPFTVGEAGYTTFSYGGPVVFSSGVEAYAAAYKAGGYIELTKLDGAAANTAVILKATPGDYTAEVKAGVVAPAANDLQISDGTVTGDGSTIFALGKKNGVVGFAKVKSGVVVPPGKAYIVISGSGAHDFIGFTDDETTGIDATLNDKGQMTNDGYFNLAGQRVAQPSKGLYIVNGKKVVLH